MCGANGGAAPQWSSCFFSAAAVAVGRIISGLFGGRFDFLARFFTDCALSAEIAGNGCRRNAAKQNGDLSPNCVLKNNTLGRWEEALATLVNCVNELQNKFSEKNVTANADMLTEALTALNVIEENIFANDAAAATPFYTGINKIDLERDGELSKASIWDGWTQQRCEWVLGTADAGEVEAMEALSYTVLFEGQEPEGQMRPAIVSLRQMQTSPVSKSRRFYTVMQRSRAMIFRKAPRSTRSMTHLKFQHMHSLRLLGL